MLQSRWLGVVVFGASLVVGLSGPLRAVEASTPSDVVLESFAVAKRGDLLVVPIQFGERTIRAMVDTGASHNFFDKTLQPLLGEVLGVRSVEMEGPDQSLPFYRAPKLRLGKLDVDDKRGVGGDDFSSLRQHCAFDAQMIVGMATLKTHILRVDFDQGLFEILEPRTAVRKSWGEPIPLTPHLDGLGYFVTLSVAGKERKFLLDTGATSTSIDQSLEKELVARSEVRPILTGKFITASGVKDRTVYGLRRMTLGPFAHEQTVVHGSELNKLGLSYLSRYQVVFDFPNDTMYLKPGERYDRADRRDMAGLQSQRRGDELIVVEAAAERAARRSGLRAGDRLDQIDGREASSYSHFELLELFAAGDQRRIPITFTRAGRAWQTTVVLDDPMKVQAVAERVQTVRRGRRR